LLGPTLSDFEQGGPVIRTTWAVICLGTLQIVKSTVEALEGNKVKVVVELEEVEFEKDLDAAFKRLAKEVRLPGFRQGKAPRKVLEARIGSDYARSEAFRDALPNYYVEAIIEHEVDAIAPPEIDIVSGEEDGPVTFDAVVEVRPAVTVEGYGSLEVEVPNPNISDSDVDEAVDGMRGNFAELETVERASTDDDRVVIDIDTQHEGESVPGLTTDGYVYTVGSGAVVPELDENLTGVSAGDELEFEADYPDSEVDEPLYFKIKVNEVQESVLPEATDEWVSENSEFETLEELRADLGANLAKTRQGQARAKRHEEITKAIIDLVEDDDAPEPMIQSEIENGAQNLAQRLQASGIELETFLQISGKNQADMVDELRESAVATVKLDLALRAIADAEQLELTEDHLETKLGEMAEATGQDAEQLRGRLAEHGTMPQFKAGLIKDLALDWVIERTQVVDEDGATIAAEDLELQAEESEAEDSVEDNK